MIRILLLLSLFCFALTAFSQEVFQRSYGGPGSEYGRAVIECSAGGYAIVGSTNSYSNPSTDVYLLRVDEMGEYMWGKNIGAPNKIDWGIDLAEDEFGNFIIAGYTNNSPTGSYDGLLLKTNSTGEVIWQKTYGGDDWDFIEGMAVNSAGEIILAGQKTEDGLQKGWVLKTDSDGEIIWETLLESSGQLKLTGIDVCDNEAIVFTGYTRNLVLDTKTFVAGRLNQNGEIVWVTNYPEFGKIKTGKCNCGLDNNLFVAGTIEYEDETHDITTFSFNIGSGSLNWNNYLELDDAFGNDITQKENGIIYFVGTIGGIGFNSYSASINSYTANGGYSGAENTAILGGVGVDELYDIKPTLDGGLIAVGETSSFGNNYQVHLCKIDSEGNYTITNTDFLDLATTITHQNSNANFEIYPNPAQNELTIRYSFYQEVNYTISTPTGTKIAIGLFENSEENKIDISTLKSGLYIISLYEKDAVIGVKRFIKLN